MKAQQVSSRLWMAALVVGGVVAGGLLGTRAVGAQTPPTSGPSGIAVTGEGQISAAPDQALVNLGVQTEAPSAQAAIQANSQAMAAVIAAVQGAGIPQASIRTVGVNISPVTAPARPTEGTPPQTVGYRATNTINVTVDDVSRAGAVLDAGIGAGANVANGLRFGFKDDAALRRQALDQAARAARTDAEALAGALGVRISGIKSVEEQGGGGGGPIPLAARAEASNAVPVEPGQLIVTASVRVVFDFQ